MMTIKKDLENFRLLKQEILVVCPSSEKPEFIHGYNEFVSFIFEELEGYSHIIWDAKAGTCDIDFELIFDEADKAVIKKSSSIEFLRGARLAEKETLEAMVFAFKFDPKHQAA